MEIFLTNRLAADGYARGADLTVYMGADESPQRTVTKNYSDYNVFSTVTFQPSMRHSWNPDNTLAQWQQHFQEDLHSQLLAVSAQQLGTSFQLEMGVTRLPVHLGWDRTGDKRGPATRSCPGRLP